MHGRHRLHSLRLPPSPTRPLSASDGGHGGVEPMKAGRCFGFRCRVVSYRRGVPSRLTGWRRWLASSPWPLHAHLLRPSTGCEWCHPLRCRSRRRFRSRSAVGKVKTKEKERGRLMGRGGSSGRGKGEERHRSTHVIQHFGNQVPPESRPRRGRRGESREGGNL